MCNATDDPVRERRHIDQLIGKPVDGLVVTARRADRRESIIPAASVCRSSRCIRGSKIPTPSASSQTTRPAQRLRSAISPPSFAHISGPERFEAVRLREMGWRQALAEAGLNAAAGDCRSAGPLRGRLRTLRPSRSSSPIAQRPDALFRGNDQIGRGAVDALREVGFAVPTDAAVVCFDNWEVMGKAARPPLTSVDMNLGALGREAGAQSSST